MSAPFKIKIKTNPLKILIIQGVVLYYYNSSAFKNTITYIYIKFLYLIKSIHFQL
nr:MAG TPA: hypothetical protein [Caudoviricetes sp.]